MNLNYFYLILATILLFSGHIVRILRWELYINVYEKPQKGSLFRGLFLGYLFNFFVPFHLGEILRAYVASKKMKNGLSFSLVTVIIDRYLDIICVGAFFLILLSIDHTDLLILNASAMYVGMGALLLVMSVGVFCFSSFIKKVTKVFARIFNENIEYHVLGFVFSAISGFKDLFKNISKIKVFGYTFGMWGLYIASYYSFALFGKNIDDAISLKDIFIGLFGSFTLSSVRGDFTTYHLYLVLFLMIPNVVLLLVSFFFKDEANGEKNKNILPQMGRAERLQFLEEYFNNTRRDFLNDYLNLNRNVSIIRDYSAGSNASTMLCVDDNNTFFRKFSFGADADKLKAQAEWIEKHSDLNLPQIIRKSSAGSSFLYDMPYDPAAMTLFQYAHSRGAVEGMEVLYRIIDDLDKTIYKKIVDGNVEKYIQKKVIDNLNYLNGQRKFAKLSETEKIVINGKEYDNLTHFMKYFDGDRLTEILSKDSFCEGHGDLTLENIIVTKDDYYLIDPNPNGDISGKCVDLGKVLQSLHSMYEIRRLVNNVEIKGNRIDFFMTSSHSYHEMYADFRKYLDDNLSVEDIKIIYTHELIHYLRLLPYRIESQNFAVFYAAFIEILTDYEAMWG